ncbi:MAG: STAS domain-containing protein [Planctomycetes bacterium]|nr:STAS domain-containing protein [Planctomycetota bacterium]
MAERRVAFSWHAVGDIIVIRMDTSPAASALDRESAVQKLGEIVAQAQGKVVLDMSGMEMIDSRTLAAVVSLNRKLQSEGGQLRLCGVTPLVRSMLDTVGLLNILHLDETDRKAIAALEQLGQGDAPSP